MSRPLDFLFREDDTLGPRMLVSVGLLAYGLAIFKPVMGTGMLILALPLIIVALGLISFAALRWLLPLMDPRHDSADRFVVWGGAALFAVAGIQGFGVWFLPGLALGAVLIWWRVPELLEILPGREERGNIDLSRRE